MPTAVDHSSENVTYRSPHDFDHTADLRFLHFNDVYHIELVGFSLASANLSLFIADINDRAGSAEPIGGISRFQTVANFYRSDPKYAAQPRLITLFSGDAFNPSLESSVTKGRHMVPILNGLSTDAACVGVSKAPFSLLHVTLWFTLV